MAARPRRVRHLISSHGTHHPLQQQNLQIRQADAVRIWILTDNYYDALRPDNDVAKRYRVTPCESIHAEHGLAYFVETLIDGKTSCGMLAATDFMRGKWLCSGRGERGHGKQKTSGFKAYPS